MFSQVLSLIGTVVVAGGGLSLIVYQVFKHLASKWLDSKFQARFHALQHGHNQEIERLRFKISALLDRATKLHQREFEVLPEAWSKLCDAYWYISVLVSPSQSYPDINRMSIPQQAEFIASSPLQTWQKSELLVATDKTALYQENIFWHKLNDAQNRMRDADIFLAKNGIFIRVDIRQRFTTLRDIVWKALAEYQRNEEYEIRPREHTDIDRLKADGERLIGELERAIHVRLWRKRDLTRIRSVPIFPVHLRAIAECLVVLGV